MNKSKSKNYFQCCQIETTLDTFILGDFFLLLITGSLMNTAYMELISYHSNLQ